MLSPGPFVRRSPDASEHVSAAPAFQDRTFEPTAVVPEPGTLGMVGIGIAYGLRRRRQGAI